MTQRQGSFKSGWQERVSALKNLPPVLGIVWRSGPSVVVSGLLLRVLASLQPIALLAVGKYIIDTIYQVIVLKRFYPVEAVIIAVLLGFVPCVIFQGVFTRVLRRWQDAHHT